MKKYPANLNPVHFVPLLVIFIYLFLNFRLGDGTHVMIHDQLDILLVDLRILADTGNIFALPNTKIDNLANGLRSLDAFIP